jgi:hypothetical protein
MENPLWIYCSPEQGDKNNPCICTGSCDAFLPFAFEQKHIFVCPFVISMELIFSLLLILSMKQLNRIA